MAAVLDVFVPSRRRERRRLREAEEERVRARWGDCSISAPMQGNWNEVERTPELIWSSPSLYDHGSPDTANTLSPDLDRFSDRLVIVDSDTEPSAQTFAQEIGKNSITVALPLSWPSRSSHSRTVSASSPWEASLRAKDPSGRFSPPPASHSTPPSVLYKPVSDQYMQDLGNLSRGGSPVSSVGPCLRHNSPPASVVHRSNTPMSLSRVGFSRASPQPTLAHDDTHNISSIMLLSPVVEDFASKPKPSFFRTLPEDETDDFSRRLPSPPIERPSTAMSTHSSVLVSEIGTAVSTFSKRSASRGPGLGSTSVMRSASREPSHRRAVSPEPTHRRAVSPDSLERRAMSREPRERRAVSREPVGRRAMSREPRERRAVSREPVGRRAMSREPTRPRAMTGDMRVRPAQSLEALRARAFSRGPADRGRSASRSSDESSAYRAADEVDLERMASTSSVGRKQWAGSAVAGSYYSSLANEYRSMAWEAPALPLSSSDNESSLVGRSRRERGERKPKEMEYAPVVVKELVPNGEDLYS